MTPQEAIQAIKIEKIQIEGNAKRVANFFEGLSVAEQALDKRIPKKPFLLMKLYPESLYSCPCCPTKVRQFERFSTGYCPRCGQTLDWSDTE